MKIGKLIQVVTSEKTVPNYNLVTVLFTSTLDISQTKTNLLSAQEQRKVTAQKPLHPLIISDFTPFHEPKNRRPNISLTEIMENQ